MGGAMLGLANMEPVVECVQCNNKLALKTKQSGGWMVSCQGEWVHRSVFTLDHSHINVFKVPPPVARPPSGFPPVSRRPQ